jgi:hypothetical protein
VALFGVELTGTSLRRQQRGPTEPDLAGVVDHGRGNVSCGDLPQHPPAVSAEYIGKFDLTEQLQIVRNAGHANLSAAAAAGLKPDIDFWAASVEGDPSSLLRPSPNKKWSRPASIR